LAKLFGVETQSAFYTLCVLSGAGGDDRMVQGLERMRCRHEGTQVDPLECMILALKHQERWATVCALDDQELLQVQTACPQALCLALHKQVLTPLPPPPPPQSQSQSNAKPSFNKEKIKKMKKRKEPNPLSCKKKKIKLVDVKSVSSKMEEKSGKKKTRRGKKRISATDTLV
jgi:hypothetical protein